MRETFPREIVIQESAPPGLNAISGDTTQLHQVIMNLCVNARDAMPAGGVLKLEARNIELTAEDVRAHQPARPGPHVAVSVADTGEGIAPAILERIFDPFFTTKALSNGTGLGLSTVLGIVRSHRGFVTVASKLGRGTTFTIYLPAASDAVAAPAGQPTDSAPRGSGELILVVDDEELVRTATRLTLENHGYRVITAGDGAEGLAIFVQNRTDVRLVLTDMMMPVMGGVTLIHAVHALEPGTKMIATSGLTDHVTRLRLEDAGVDAVVQKPCDPFDLLKAIALQLSGPRPLPRAAAAFDKALSA
jgi:two-component system, cell cycle sensor histidine kinase and response regulator CckA